MSSLKTMKEWAIEVKSYEKLPSFFKDSVRSLIKEDDEFPYMVHAPRNKNTNKPEIDQLLIFKEDHVIILMNLKDGVAKQEYSVYNIQSIQIGTILLHSWLKLCFINEEGYGCSLIYYDTVMEDLFIPVIDKIRYKTLDLKIEGPEPHADELSYLKDVSLKFYNYGVQSLLPGQKVCCSVYQPRIDEETVKKSETHETAPHLFVLTEEELILIQETEQEERSATQKYSGIWTYFPISQIESFNVETQEDGQWMKASVRAEGQEPVQVVIDPRNRQAIQVLASHLKASME